MSNAQTSNSFASSDNLRGQSITSQEVTPAIAFAQPRTETADIIELTDEQLEAVAGGFWWLAAPVLGLLGISALQIVQIVTGQEKSPGASRASSSGAVLLPPKPLIFADGGSGGQLPGSPNVTQPPGYFGY